MRLLVFIAALLAFSMALGQNAASRPCRTEEDLALRVLQYIRKGDSLGIRSLVPTVGELLKSQEEERTPGAFRIDTEEAEKVVHGIDSIAMASFRRANTVAQRLPQSSLKPTSTEKSDVQGDMPFSDITVFMGKGSLTCVLEIKTAMGFSSGWKLGWGGFSFLCVQE